MRLKTLTLSAFASAFIIIGLHHFMLIRQSPKRYNKAPLYQRIGDRFKHEADKVRDPNTGIVPVERLLTAQKVIQRKLNQKDAIPGINWEERGPTNIAGRARSILIDKRDPSGNTLFVGGVSGGLWKTTNGGSSWTKINDFFNNMSISSIVQDPNNLNTIYFGTGEYWALADDRRGAGIYRSTDGGATFNPMAFTVNNRDFDFINRLAIQSYNGNTVLYAATSSIDNARGGLMITQNGGNSWLVWRGDNSGTNNFASDVRITAPDPGNGGNSVVIAAFGNSFESDGVYASLNGGTTWFQEYTAHPNEGRIELATSPSDPYIRYLLCESISPQLLPTMHGRAFVGINYTYVPITVPLTWRDLDCNNPALDFTRGQDFYDLTMAVDPQNPFKVLVGTIDLWMYQRDPFTFIEGWTQISHWIGNCGLQNVHADQHFIVYENNNEAWVSNDGGIYKSDNANTTFPSFSFRGNGLNITQFYSGDAHPTTGTNEYLTGSQDNGSQHFKSPGLSTTNMVTGGDGGFSHIDQSNPNIQITSYTNQTYTVTLDGWVSQQQPVMTTGGRFINPTDYDDISKKLYCANGSQTYTRWENPATGGNTLTTVTVANFPTNISDPRAWSVRVSPNVANSVYFGFDGGRVVRVDDAHTGTNKTGKVIFNLNAGNSHVVSCIEIEKGNENHVLITLSNYGITSIYESTNALATTPSWTPVEGNLPDIPVRWAMFNPNNSDQAFIATELGIWSTTNLSGSNTDWDPTNAGLANTRIDMIKYRESDKQMVVASHGRGLFTSDDLVGNCDPMVTLNGLTLSGTYSASESITTANSTVSSSVLFSAPQVNINLPFTVNNGGIFTIQNTGCL